MRLDTVVTMIDSVTDEMTFFKEKVASNRLRESACLSDVLQQLHFETCDIV